MKRSDRQCQPALILGAAAIVLLAGCRDKVMETITYTANVPVYAKEESLEKSIGSSEPRALSSHGKIHVSGHYIYVVEPFRGIHVIDNADPATPVNASYIPVPGVVDIASHGTTLYADSYDDLLSIDIANPMDVREVDRDENVFVPVLPPTGNEYPIAEIDPGEGVVVGWRVEEVTETREVDQWNNWQGANRNGGSFQFTNSGTGDETLSAAIQQRGQGGSMARFTVFGLHLYAVNEREIKVFDLSSPADPSEGTTVQVDRDVETLFPMDEKLFVGTTSGMVIYGLSDPSSPAFISDFNHSTACDPVVVEDDHAYVTLRSGTPCGGWDNQLDVINIADIANPQWVATYPMTSPHGLGIDDGLLFICDGSDGLKVYDASVKTAIDQHRLAHFADIHAYDVIPLGEVLLLIGDNGLYQYGYDHAGNVQLLSVIPVNPAS